jgi:methylated-DNA-[protein]-cysteine S-methyltransferase
MLKTIRYTIFKTRWGYFGLAGTEMGLLRTHLPLADPGKVKTNLLANFPAARHNQRLFNPLQKQIIAYFNGTYAVFNKNIPIVMDGLSPFTVSVLRQCRKIGFGRTISYGRLAEKTGRPAAARAVGSALAKNPLPLIIPCHRVICSDGKIGGFSAIGGITLKRKMLELEAQGS